MHKSQATSLFGDVASMAKAIGITVQAIYIWPDELTDAISDRVVAAFARKCNKEGRHAEFWSYLRGTAPTRPLPAAVQKQAKKIPTGADTPGRETIKTRSRL